MKTKINVTIEEEQSLQSQIDDDKAKDILSKLKNNHGVFLMKKSFTTMIIENNKIQLKKGKWFKKFKSIQLINIEKSFILSDCQEFILLFVNIGKFSGYIVLKIDVASNLMEFVDILQKVLNHHHIIIQKGQVYYELENENKYEPIVLGTDSIDRYNPVDMVDSTDPPVNIIENYESVSNINDNNQKEPDNYEFVDSRNSILRISNNNKPPDNHEFVDSRNSILRISNNTEQYTYLNNDLDEITINDIGPVALFSQTFPSSYRISDDINNYIKESGSESESDSHSENGQQIM